jgi:hypothetical protein
MDYVRRTDPGLPQLLRQAKALDDDSKMRIRKVVGDFVKTIKSKQAETEVQVEIG